MQLYIFFFAYFFYNIYFFLHIKGNIICSLVITAGESVNITINDNIDTDSDNSKNNNSSINSNLVVINATIEKVFKYLFVNIKKIRIFLVFFIVSVVIASISMLCSDHPPPFYHNEVLYYCGNL
jgi:hypothetical protein